MPQPARSGQGLAQAWATLFANYPDREATRAHAETFSLDETTQGQLRPSWIGKCFLLQTNFYIFVYNRRMPRKPPVIFPQEQALLSGLGERFKLARKRRKLSNAVVAQRAGISRASLYKVEAGDPGATLGTYLRVLAVLGLEGDVNAIAADDKLGRKLQDLALEPS